MESTAEITLRNLHVLGALSHNDKLMTNEDSFDIYAPTSLRGVLRMWYRENRAANIERVRTAVRAGIQFSERTLQEAESLRAFPSVLGEVGNATLRANNMAVQHRRMVEALERACHGLINLLQTYRDDAAMAAQINLVIEEVRSHLGVVSEPSHSLARWCGHLGPSFTGNLGRPGASVSSPRPPRTPPSPSSPRVSYLLGGEGDAR